MTDHLVLEMRDDSLIWWQLFLPSCKLRYWAITPSPFMPLHTFPQSIADIFASKFVQHTTPTLALTDHPRVRYNMNHNEEEQAAAHLEMLQRAGKFVIRWMSYPNASYLKDLGNPPTFGAGHPTTPTFDTHAEATSHRMTWLPAIQIQTQVVILTKDGGYTMPTFSSPTGLLTETADYDVEGSWGDASKDWPEIANNARDMFVFANCVETIPYGSYVLMHDRCLRVHHQHIEQLKKDFIAAGQPTAQDSIARRGGQAKSVRWWENQELKFFIAGWDVSFNPNSPPHITASKPRAIFTGSLPAGVAKDICIEYARVVQRYRSAVAFAQELSSSPTPERVRDIRDILDEMQADSENL